MQDEINVHVQSDTQRVQSGSVISHTTSSQRNILHHKAFLMMLEVAIWFLVPAFVGLFLGKHFDHTLDTGRKYQFICLATTFIFSWVMVLWRVSHINRELKKLSSHKK